jgi:hypothetical protein
MGSTSIIIGEVVASTPLAEAPSASTTHGGVPTLAAAAGGEVTTLSSISASPRHVAQTTSCGREKMGQLAPLVASSSACMTKHLVKTKAAR